MKFRILLTVMLLATLLCGATAAESVQPGLFEEDSILELGLRIDMDEVCRPREDPECDYEPGVLTYLENDETRSIPIEYIVRGGWRSLSANCQVPLLFIRFSETETEGTPFAGQKSLPLTTHCGRSNLLEEQETYRPYLNYEQYLLKEYLAYRLYNQLNELSLRVRLLKVRYEDPKKPGKGISYFAFFTEHFESLAERSNTRLLERDSFDDEKLDQPLADIVAMYQFMIGNTDWSIARQRNTILLETADGQQKPVPFDLDMSGLVNAPYAGPPPSLPIDEVTERFYLGYCHPDIDWNALFRYFLNRKADLQAEIFSIADLYKKEKNSARRYLDQFYRILTSPEKRREKIIDTCQPWPPTADDHMAPANLHGR